MPMISRNLTKRLKRLEERILPPTEVHLLRVVFVDTDGTEVGGFTVSPWAVGEIQSRASRDEWGICRKP